MTWRLLLILLAVAQIAALPVVIEPPTLTIGEPLSVQVALPDEAAELIGLPDLGPLALLEPPRRSGTTFTLRLLPVRPGPLTFPPLPFQTGQSRFSTAATELMIEAPPLPDSPLPVRALPEPTPAGRPSGLWLPLSAGVLGLLLLSAVVIHRRRPAAAAQTAGAEDPLAQLAAAVERYQLLGHPEWLRLRQQLEHLRFAPVQHSDADIQALAAELNRLRGELS